MTAKVILLRRLMLAQQEIVKMVLRQAIVWSATIAADNVSWPLEVTTHDSTLRLETPKFSNVKHNKFLYFLITPEA